MEDCVADPRLESADILSWLAPEATGIHHCFKNTRYIWELNYNKFLIKITKEPIKAPTKMLIKQLCEQQACHTDDFID